MSESITIEAANVQQDAARKAYAAAVKSFEGVNDGKHDITQLIEAGDAVRASGVAVTRAEAVAKTAVFAQFAGERNTASQRIHDAIKAVITIERDTLIRCGVDGVAVSKIDLTLDAPTVGVAFSGEGLKAPRAPRGAGTGNGFKSAGAGTAGGVEYRSRNAAYITIRGGVDGISPSDVTPANSESADRWLTKNGTPFVPDAA